MRVTVKTVFGTRGLSEGDEEKARRTEMDADDNDDDRDEAQ